MTEKALAVKPQPNLTPQTYGEMQHFSKEIAHSSFCPKDFKGKPGEVMIAIQYGSEVGLAPLQALQNIAVINGKPSIWGDAMMALAQSHPDCEYINETFDEPSMTARCESKRRGAAPKVTNFTQEDAQKAGLWKKQGPWTQYPKRMLQMRARGFNLRDNFADAMRGMISREEAQDYPDVMRGEMKNVTAESRVVPPVVEEEEFSDSDMGQFESTLMKAAQDNELKDVWLDQARRYFPQMTPEQRVKITAFKDGLKRKDESQESEAKATVGITQADDAEGIGSKPEEKPKPGNGRRKKSDQAEPPGEDIPSSNPTGPEVPPSHSGMSAPGKALMMELEASESRSLFFSSNKERLDLIPPPDQRAIEARSAEMDEQEGGG